MRTVLAYEIQGDRLTWAMLLDILTSQLGFPLAMVRRDEFGHALRPFLAFRAGADDPSM